MGRPRKYTKKTLSEAVELYFASITRKVTPTERVDTGERDDKGHKIYEQRPIENSLGEIAEIEEYIIPPTIGGLCRHLGIHRSTWAEYCARPEHEGTAKTVEGRIQAYLEQQLLLRKDVRGIIFDLQNNHGYAEKRQIELGERAGKAISAGAIPMSEKKALLEEIAREFAGGGGADGQAED